MTTPYQIHQATRNSKRRWAITSPGGVLQAMVYGDELKGRAVLDFYNAEPPAMTPAEEALGGWLSAALDDPAVCAEMKADIQAWMDEKAPYRRTPLRCNLIPVHRWAEVPGSATVAMHDNTQMRILERCDLCETTRWNFRKRT